MKRLIPLILAGLMLVAISGCCHKKFTGVMMPEPPAATKGEIPFFQYDSRINEIPISHVKNVEENDIWKCEIIEFRVKDFEESPKNTIKAYRFTQKNTDRNWPILIVMPPTGGPRHLVKDFSEFYADKGFQVLAFMRRERFFKPENSLEYNKHLFRQSVIDIRRGIDYMQIQPNTLQDKVAVMGVSLGGILAALAVEADGRILVGGTIVSAAYLPEILDTSGYKTVRKYRNALMKSQNVERDNLCGYIMAYVYEIDPATYADRIDPGRFIMVNGTLDNIIKYKVAKMTWEKYGRPEMRTVPLGHYSTMIMIGYAQKKLYDHFCKILLLEEDENGMVRTTNCEKK